MTDDAAKLNSSFQMGLSLPEAQARTSHLAIGAHQDDLEFMAFHGISLCFGDDLQWFGGVTCTDGGGSRARGAFRLTKPMRK